MLGIRQLRKRRRKQLERRHLSSVHAPRAVDDGLRPRICKSELPHEDALLFGQHSLDVCDVAVSLERQTSEQHSDTLRVRHEPRQLLLHVIVVGVELPVHHMDHLHQLVFEAGTLLYQSHVKALDDDGGQNLCSHELQLD